MAQLIQLRFHILIALMLSIIVALGRIDFRGVCLLILTPRACHSTDDFLFLGDAAGFHPCFTTYAVRSTEQTS